jgi:hypothetical protein
MMLSNFDSTAPEELTLQSLTPRWLNEETRQLSGTLTIPALVIADSIRIKTEQNVALAVTSRSSRNVTCHFCDKQGHYKTE